MTVYAKYAYHIKTWIAKNTKQKILLEKPLNESIGINTVINAVI